MINNILDKVGIVIPTHCSKKGVVNGAWGPPNLGWITTTIESLHENIPETHAVSKTIVLNQPQRSPTYEANLRVYCESRGYTLRLDCSSGYRGVRLGMLDWFDKDYLFLIEHDWKWNLNIDLTPIIQTFEDHDHVNYIRFNKRDNHPKKVLTSTRRVGGDLYLIKDERVNINILHTPQYSNNPHIERMSKYREWCKIVEQRKVNVGGNGGAGGFEHPLQEQSLNDLEQYGAEERNKMWGTYIYGKIGDPAATKHFGI